MPGNSPPAPQLAILIEAVPDVIYFKDREGRHTLVNQAMVDLTGLAREEIRGRTNRDLLPPELAAACDESDRRVIEEGHTVREEEGMPGPGGWHIFDTIKTPLTNADGRITGLVGISRDITDRKRERKELERSEKIFRGIFEGANDQIIIHEITPALTPGRITEVNSRVVEVLGYTREELLDLTLPEITAPQTDEEADWIREDVITRERAIFEATLVAKDGREIPVEVSANIIEEDGKRTSISIIRDITDRRELERLKKEAFVTIDRTLEQLATLNDQIRNPLTVIVGYADVVGGPEGEEIIRMAKQIDRIVTALDEGWLESKKVRDFLRRYYFE